MEVYLKEVESVQNWHSGLWPSKWTQLHDTSKSAPSKSFMCPPTSFWVYSGISLVGYKLKSSSLTQTRKYIIVKYRPKLHLVPEELGNYAELMEQISREVGFFQSLCRCSRSIWTRIPNIGRPHNHPPYKLYAISCRAHCHYKRHGKGVEKHSSSTKRMPPKWKRDHFCGRYAYS